MATAPTNFTFANAFNNQMGVVTRPSGRVQFSLDGGGFLLEAAQKAALANAVLNPTSVRLTKPLSRTSEPETVIVGEGKTEARVYVPTSDGGAERNLNFARANLAAQQIWAEREPERKAKARRETDERAAKLAAAQKAMDELAATVGDFTRGVGMSIQRSRALRAYNARYGTTYPSWERTGSTPRTVDTWIAVVDSIDSTSLKR